MKALGQTGHQSTLCPCFWAGLNHPAFCLLYFLKLSKFELKNQVKMLDDERRDLSSSTVAPSTGVERVCTNRSLIPDGVLLSSLVHCKFVAPKTLSKRI